MWALVLGYISLTRLMTETDVSSVLVYEGVRHDVVYIPPDP